MTDLSPELAAFAARLDTEPDAVQVIFRYCLAMLMVEQGQADLARVELRGREPWCTFKAVGGGEFTVPRPSLNPAEEQRMLKTLAEIFHEKGAALAETSGMPIAYTTMLAVIESATRALNQEIVFLSEAQPQDTKAAHAAPAQRPKAAKGRPRKAAAPQAAAEEPPMSAAESGVSPEDAPEVVQELQQLVVQAWTATKALRAIMEEVQRVTETAWAATREQRLVLAEVRSAIRQYEQTDPGRKPPRREHLMEDRDKQLTLAILGGMTLKEAEQKFGLSIPQIKRIYHNQFRRLHQLEKTLGLSREDLVAIGGHGHPHLITGQRLYAGRIKELLEKMWAYDEQ